MFEIYSIENIAKVIVEDRSRAMTSDAFYELVRKAAQRERRPKENATQAAARIFTEPSPRGRLIRQAYDQLRS
jgi:hypothetical protein